MSVDSSFTTRQMCEQFLRYGQKLKMPSTSIFYLSKQMIFLRYFGHSRCVNSINTTDLIHLHFYLIHSKQVASTLKPLRVVTVQSCMKFYAAQFRWAKETGRINKNPFIAINVQGAHHARLEQ